VAAWVPDIFYNFYFLMNHKIADNSTTSKATEKISADLESIEFKKFFDVCLTNFKDNQILRNKISHRVY
jgi:hypothetical protein